MTKVCMIMAIGPNGVIGKGKELAWHSKKDFYHFKTQTNGYPCIFGDVTFYNLPKYPLKNRLNIVVNINNDNTYVLTNENQGSWIETNTIEKAISFSQHYDKVFICGGKSVYKYCLDNNLIDEIYLTKISDPTGKFEEEITANPEEFVYFPIDLDEYTKTWYREKITYDLDTTIQEPLSCDFIKFTR